MRFNNWTLDELIRYLERCKSAPLLDCHNVTRCFGEIHLFNGEEKDDKSLLYADMEENIDATVD